MTRSIAFASAAFAALTTITLAFAPFSGPQTLDLSWHSQDSGGGASQSGSLEIRGTIGQCDATNAVMTAGSLSLTGGFWIPEMCGLPCLADITGGGMVDVDDLLSVINGWGPCLSPCPPNCLADITSNCVVDVDDLLVVINGWGACP